MEKNLNDTCFEFQQKIVDIFNNEQQIPFILKYYLFKDIWKIIDSNKMNIDIETHSKFESEEKSVVLDLNKDEDEASTFNHDDVTI